MAENTHYRLVSAIAIEGIIRMPGSVITTEQLETLPPEAQELVLRDEHVVPCPAPNGIPATPPSPFPRKQVKPKAE